MHKQLWCNLMVVKRYGIMLILKVPLTLPAVYGFFYLMVIYLIYPVADLLPDL